MFFLVWHKKNEMAVTYRKMADRVYLFRNEK